MSKITSFRNQLLNIMKEVVDDYNKQKLDEKIIEQFENIILQIKEDKKQHYLSINENGQASYAYKPDVKLIQNKRRLISLFKYIANFTDYNKQILKSSMVMRFAEVVFTKFLANIIDVQVVCGQEIIDCYELFDLDSRCSCMTHRTSLLDLYAKNADKVSLLFTKNIRSLLWKTDCGNIILDRCYPSGHFEVNILKEWALNKGYGVRSCLHKAIKKDIIDIYHPTNINKQYFVTLKSTSVFPFLDTFCFGKFYDDKLILSNSIQNMKFYFQNVHGIGQSIPCASTCVHCGKKDRFGKICQNNYYCADCQKILIHYCDNCDLYFVGDEGSCPNCSDQ